MSEHICGWDLLRRKEYEQARAAFEARADYDQLVSEAAARGFRRITLGEQLNQTVDAYLWRGGVWVKNSAEQ